VECKNCRVSRIVKSGFVRGEPQYKCEECGVHFVEGDARTSDKIAALKALCVVLYALCKRSCSLLGKIFGRNRSLIYRWERK
jgi:transposase-like protein